MCGICGIVDFDGEPIDRDLVQRMVGVIEHRGPDGEGFYFNGEAAVGRNGSGSHLRHASAALGARRLAIIDVAAGHQPISNEDGTVWVAYNGEIYNFAELREELISAGHSFRTHCDTEVIVHAYEEWGDECVTRFNGMFAYALWDDKRQRLVLARDRMGVKPLVYVQQGRRLLFGSELKSLLEDPSLAREIDLDVLVTYLSFFAVPEPYSLLRGVKRVPAGHILIFEDGVARLKKYWDLDFTEGIHRSEKKWLEELETLLEDAVRIRLISEVPLGAFLSGGIDSSLVVAMMARAETDIKTCAIEFTPGYSEAGYARLVADRFKTDHLEYSFGRDDAWEKLPDMVWHNDEPSQSLIQSYFVSKAARERVTVALSGLGGDELFTGYPAHLAAQRFRHIDKIPRTIRSGVHRVVRSVNSGSRLSRFLESAAMTPEFRFASRYLHATEPADRAGVLSAELHANANTSAATEYLLALFDAANSKDFRNRVLYVDQKAYLANELLRTTDSMSMAHSLEVRTPFLDYRVVELAARMPVSMKIRGRTTKYAIRKLAERLLPREISRRSKSGFTPPIRNWITRSAEEFARDHLSADKLKRRGFFNSRHVESLMDEHFAGGRDRSQWILMLLTFEIWHELFIDRAPAASREPSAAAVL